MMTVKETKKAKLLEQDEVKFWIQKRWQRADGSLTPAGEHSFEEASERAAERAKGEKYYKISDLVERETDKAVMIKVDFDICNLEKTVTWSIWLPKSLLKNGYAPSWFLAKKIEQAEREIYDRFHTGGLIETEFTEFIYVKK